MDARRWPALFRRAMVVATLGGSALARGAGAQPPRALPFASGERLEYDARAGRVVSGRAEMWIDGPVEVQGVAALVMHFTFNTRVGPLVVSDQTTSWWDPLRRGTLRFEKRERHLLDRHSEEVTIDRQSGYWKAADGRDGFSPSPAPLDELSFIYVIRTLDIGRDALTLERHFDPARNPTVLRFVGRDTVEIPSGRYPTREVEMRVRDSRHYRGEGVIRFSLSDDPCSRPLRIVSDIPGAGHVVMTLRTASPAVAGCAPAQPRAQ